MPADVLRRLLKVAESLDSHAAVIETSGTVSYGEFVGRVRRTAAAITAVTNVEHPKVLIHLPQGADAYASMFATLMAGGYYAATNVAAPQSYRDNVARRFAPDVVVTTASERNGLNLEGVGSAVINVDSLPATELSESAPAHDLAYVMFTSGSTGEPKGVMVGRGGLAHYAAWATDAMEVTPSDRWSQHPNIAFDLSVLDIYGALCSGASLVPIEGRRDRLVPAEVVRRHGITIWDSVPSVIDLMQRAGHVTHEHLYSLRLMTFCGEPLLPTHLEAIFAARPDLVVHNTYGPTEATVSCTLIRLTSENYRNACGVSVALGDPIPHMRLHLVGGGNNHEGEIVLEGPQVARGYWQDAVTTASAFQEIEVEGAFRPVYRTGDWAVRAGGHLHFVSRTDRQVKVHGHRLELGEVDAALRACGAVAACAVLVDGKVHAFVEKGSGLNISELRHKLAKKLPSHANPASLRIVDQLPRSQNDKIDSRELSSRLKSEMDFDL